jgi:hypothetical protein
VLAQYDATLGLPAPKGAPLADDGKTYGARSRGQIASQFGATFSKSRVATFCHFAGNRIRAQEINELVCLHDQENKI